jgi:hypothetical protein
MRNSANGMTPGAARLGKAITVIETTGERWYEAESIVLVVKSLLVPNRDGESASVLRARDRRGFRYRMGQA